MNQLVYILNESNDRYQQLKRGTYGKTLEILRELRSESQLQVKTIGTMIHLHSVGVKAKQLEKQMDRINVLDDSTAIEIPLGDPEVDKVKCPEHDDLITRSECLDYSGAHHDECSGCEIGRATKEKLIPVQ